MSEVVAELRPEGILSHVSAQDLETLKFYGVFGEYGPGEIVVNEGAEQDRLYVIISGKLNVIIQSAGTEVLLGSIGTGDCIGEISIFEPGVASATVKVVETAVLWHLDVAALQNFFEQVPAAGGMLMLGIAQLLSRRLRLANQAILANRMLPKHLGVRSGAREPITAETVKKDEDKSIFKFFGKKTGKA
jgi:CRP/FNR family transcriptional regulator, cyclic AMP receptor protein